MKMNWSDKDNAWECHVYFTAWWIKGYGHEVHYTMAPNESTAELAAREMFEAAHEHEEDVYEIDNVFCSEVMDEIEEAS